MGLVAWSQAKWSCGIIHITKLTTLQLVPAGSLPPWRSAEMATLNRSTVVGKAALGLNPDTQFQKALKFSPIHLEDLEEVGNPTLP